MLLFLVIDTAALVAQSETAERLIPAPAARALRTPRAPDVQLAVSAWLAHSHEAEGELGFAPAYTAETSCNCYSDWIIQKIAF